MYESIYILAAAMTAIISLTAVWAGRSRRHWFWRSAALLICFLVLIPVGAAELNLLLAPVAGLLFLASAGKQWWDRRRPGNVANGSDPADERDNAAKVRISLKELFLVIFLAAIAAWIAARIVKEGPVLEWIKLPIAVVIVAAVAWIAAMWVEKPRTWQPMWAKTAAYVIGLAMIPASIHSLIYVLQWESALDITIAAASFVCLSMVFINYWLIHVGRMPQTVLLAAAIYAAAYIHAEFLGDWLSADHLLSERWPTFWLQQRILYGLLYVYLAAFVLFGVLVGRGLRLPTDLSRRNFLLSRLSVAALAGVVVPLGWLYVRLLDAPQLAPFAVESDASSLSEANRVLAKIEAVRKATPRAAPVTVMGLPLPDTAEVRQLTRELIVTLEKHSGRLPPSDRLSVAQSPGEVAQRRRKLIAARQVFWLGYIAGPAGGSSDLNSQYALAQILYANEVQREGLASDVKDAYAWENEAYLLLALKRDQLSPQRRRELVQALERIDANRVPLKAILARDAHWSERHERWRSRLRRVVLGRTSSADSGTPMDTLQWRRDSCIAAARLTMTELAINLFREEEGRLPSGLEELVPRYLNAVPKDPYTANSLVYRHRQGGHAVYSVGPDEADNGGVSPVDCVLDSAVQYLEKRLARSQTAAKAPTAPTKAAPMASKTGRTQ